MTALVATVVVLLVGVVATGLAAPAAQAPIGDRIGAAFVSQVGTADGLALVVAAGMLAWACSAGGAPRAVSRLRRAILAAAAVLFVVAPFAAWGDVAFLHRTHAVVDMVTRRQLATYLAVTMIPDGAAALLAWWVGAPAWASTTTLP